MRGDQGKTVSEGCRRKVMPTLEAFLDTPVVRCDDGEIIIYPKLSLVEIDGELLTADDVAELAGAFTEAIRQELPNRPVGAGRTVAGHWHVDVEGGGVVVVNGSPYATWEIARYVRSLRYAARLMDE